MTSVAKVFQIPNGTLSLETHEDCLFSSLVCFRFPVFGFATRKNPQIFLSTKVGISSKKKIQSNFTEGVWKNYSGSNKRALLRGFETTSCSWSDYAKSKVPYLQAVCCNASVWDDRAPILTRVQHYFRLFRCVAFLQLLTLRTSSRKKLLFLRVAESALPCRGFSLLLRATFPWADGVAVSRITWSDSTDRKH